MDMPNNIAVVCEYCHTIYVVGDDDDSILNCRCPVCGIDDQEEDEI